MYNQASNNQFSRMETMCSLLLTELQKIWSEVGEADDERDKLVYEIEQECVEVYRRKVIEANKCRSELLQSIAVAESEIQNICSALGEKPAKCEEKVRLNLKEEYETIVPRLREMRKRRAEREKEFVEVVEKLGQVSCEIFGSAEDSLYKRVVDGSPDLSMPRLDGLKKRLLELENEKRDRLKKIMGHVSAVKSHCGVLGVDFKQTVQDIHPSLDDSEGAIDMTDDTINKLVTVIQSLRAVKIQRMQKLQDLATSLVELWNLMDTPVEEQRAFYSVICKIAALEPEINEPDILSTDFINHVEEEVSRLEKLKSSKVKELVLKKRLELGEIYRNTHMVIEAHIAKKYSTEAIVSEFEDPVHLLEEIEVDIARVKEDAFSRKEILDKVEKWLAICEEESWLEEYNRDENRYNAGRGAHLNLKRAGKARAVVKKIPATVEALNSKITAWEKERGIPFFYDDGRLLFRLEQYSSLKEEKEQERLRQKDQKKLQVQKLAEPEALFGSKSSPSRSGRKASIGVQSNRKLSLGGAMLPNFKAEKTSALVHQNKKSGILNRSSSLRYEQRGDFASKSAGRRNSEIAGHLVKKHPSTAAKAHKTESHLIRKPLSPVSLTMSFRANIANFEEDHKRTHSGTLRAMLPCNKTNMDTPSKSIYAGDGENRNPKALPIPVPSTPSTLVPMLMALTPGTPYVSDGSKTAQNILEHGDYSFEEVRAGFIGPKPQSQWELLI